jgi:hypothetical protein
MPNAVMLGLEVQHDVEGPWSGEAQL